MPCCRLEVDAGRISEAEQRADPGRYRVPVSDMSPDQKWQGVMVTEEEFSFKGLRALAEAEWHEHRVWLRVIGSSVSSPTSRSRTTGRA